jgi:SWI/SNF-related matrix-associated actin-dependent regulator of chromatin subfamily B protein 1
VRIRHLYSLKSLTILFRPSKLDPEDANRPEELVPIRLEFDIEHHKIRDTFVWNMNGR